MAGKLSSGVVAVDKGSFTDHYGFLYPRSRSFVHIGSNSMGQKIELMKLNNGHLSSLTILSSSDSRFSEKPYTCTFYKERAISCCCRRTFSSEAKGHMRKSEEFVEASSDQLNDGDNGGTGQSLCKQQPVPGNASKYVNGGLAQACKFAYNDAKIVNERVCNDIFLLSRGIARLNKRARQDVAVLGLGFLKLDARAREDTEKIDHGVKKAANIHNVVTGNAHSKLKRVVDQHWSDGALEADIRRADLAARRRAIEDAFMALKFVKRIHDMMVNKLYEQPQSQGSFSVNDILGFITLEKNGKALDVFTQEVSSDRITAIQDAYWTMASALSEADGIDYTDPEELELLVATLIDLDAMDGKGSVSLLAECSSSPDVGTRQALANALAAAPSIWILGNAGMGALQRLAEDNNPAVAAAASKAIEELKQQWELEEGDSLRFMMNQFYNMEGKDDTDSEADNLTG